MNEDEWQAQVIEAAHLFGWRHNFTRRARGPKGYMTPTSVTGWPDLTFWSPRRGGIFLAELKSDTGRIRPEQLEVIDSLRSAGVPAFIWRPSDWPEVERVLRYGPERPTPTPP